MFYNEMFSHVYFMLLSLLSGYSGLFWQYFDWFVVIMVDFDN